MVWGVAMAIAVEMRCAMMQPTIFSRWGFEGTGRRKRYALEDLRIESVNGGDASAKLIVSSKWVSWVHVNKAMMSAGIVEPLCQFFPRRLQGSR